MVEYALELRGVGKNFGPVKALNAVNIAVKRGEIHAICGENGAGKSTLMKIISGFYPFGSYEGELKIHGERRYFPNTRASENVGVAIIYQELALVDELSICENIFLGHELIKGWHIDWDRCLQQAQNLLAEVKLSVSAATPLSQLGIGEKQLVEIAKALAQNASILILDEPTAALTEHEATNLLQLIAEMRSKGKTCLYISHRLDEVFKIADTITVLRDGRSICSQPCAAFTENSLITQMVGRELTHIYPYQKRQKGKPVLDVKGWTVFDPQRQKTVVAGASFTLHEGELLGIAGLMGAGRTELAMSLFGEFGQAVQGEVYLDGKPLRCHSAKEAIQAGLAFVSEDRKHSGLVLGMTIKENTSLASLSKFTRFGLINHDLENQETLHYIEKLRVKAASLSQEVGHLSGGNQQKVVLAKWLLTKPRVLILDEPTRGIDVGAKAEIYRLINELLASNICILMISSELPEIIGMCDRILVMHAGRIQGELSHGQASQEKIMRLATGNVGGRQDATV